MALAEKRSGRILARAVATDTMGDAALVNVCAVDALLVSSEALVAVAGEVTDGVLAAAILT